MSTAGDLALALQVVSLVLNALVVPAVIAQVKLNFNHETRLAVLEHHVGLATEEKA